MASWPTGIDSIKGLLAANSLQKVAPSREATQAMLDAAARKSLAAVLQAQGHRSTSRGGHYAIQEAISAQFTKLPPRDAFRSFGRLRRARNQIEYDDISPTTPDDIAADEPVVRALHATASQLVEVLPVFVD